MLCQRFAPEQGDSLIEVMASVLLLGIVLIPFGAVAINSFTWVATDTQIEQALSYAKQGIDNVRQQELAAYTQKTFPVSVSPQSLPAVRGVSYAEAITGPTSPPWMTNSALGLRSWAVTVSWKVNSTGVTHAVTLQVIVDPAIGSGASG